MKLKNISLLAPALCLLLAFSAPDNTPSIAPVKMTKAKVAAEYGVRTNPATGEKQTHTGIDLRIAEGEPVVTTANGTVLESRFDEARGNFVVIKHNEVYTTSYSHLKFFTVKAGDIVKVGQSIGFVGSTGKSSGPHLHYEVIKDGKAVDPKAYLPGI